MEFKDRLKSLRTEFGISGEELGRRIGVGRAAIGNYESGLRKPRQEQLEALADVFNVDIDYLLGRTSKKLKVSFEKNRMICLMDKLNQDGQREAVKRVEELTYVPTYTASDETRDDLLPYAAHERTDVEITDEMREHDRMVMEQLRNKK